MKHSSSNKWLIRKASGSKARHKVKGHYSKDKEKALDVYEDLPYRETIKKSRSYLDTSLVKRWLFNRVGHDFDLIYSEFISRLQPKYKDEYKESIFWYVERKELVTITENGEVWGKTRSNAVAVKLPNSVQSTFYVDPETNKLYRIPTSQFRR